MPAMRPHIDQRLASSAAAWGTGEIACGPQLVNRVRLDDRDDAQRQAAQHGGDDRPHQVVVRLAGQRAAARRGVAGGAIPPRRPVVRRRAVRSRVGRCPASGWVYPAGRRAAVRVRAGRRPVSGIRAGRNRRGPRLRSPGIGHRGAPSAGHRKRNAVRVTRPVEVPRGRNQRELQPGSTLRPNAVLRRTRRAASHRAPAATRQRDGELVLHAHYRQRPGRRRRCVVQLEARRALSRTATPRCAAPTPAPSGGLGEQPHEGVLHVGQG